MVINEKCKICQIKRNNNRYPVGATEEKIKEYQYKVNEIVKNSDGLTTPQVAEQMDNLRKELFGNTMDYTEIKQHYNKLMLDYFPYMENKVNTSENHLKMAIQYAMVGNYIDFGALENVNDIELKEKEVYDLKHELIVSDSKAETATKELNEALEKIKSLEKEIIKLQTELEK